MTDESSTMDATAERLRALQAARKSGPSPTPKKAGPAPARIVAAAVSVSAGIGLVALMAGTQQDVVVQVSPTPITVQPARVIVEMSDGTSDEVSVRVVEAAVPVERPAPQARVVSQSEGS